MNAEAVGAEVTSEGQPFRAGGMARKSTEWGKSVI